MATPLQIYGRESARPSKVDAAEAIAALDIAGTAFTPTAAIFSNAGGTATLTFANGSTALLTLAAGVVYPFKIKACTAGTIADLFGLY
jgi:hypothetical protein